jgi:TRAP-type C4-dicarboxylate transport system permease small subunit
MHPHEAAPLRVVRYALDWLTLTGFVLMLLAAWGQVVFRYWLEISVPWTEEVARLLFATTMFFAMAIAFRKHEHVVVDFLLNRLSPRGLRGVRFCYLLAILAFLLVWVTGAVHMARSTWEAHVVTVAWLRLGHIYLAEAIAVGLMAGYAVLDLVDIARGHSGPEAA